VHFASAMTLLDRIDGQGADDDVSYMELALNPHFHTIALDGVFA